MVEFLADGMELRDALLVIVVARSSFSSIQLAQVADEALESRI